MNYYNDSSLYDGQNLTNISSIYTIYDELFNSNITILQNCNDNNYTIYIDNINHIPNYNNSQELTHITVEQKNIKLYKSICEGSKLYENIPLLLNKKYSVIILNQDNNVIAIHHPENTHNLIRLPFCFIP